MLDGSDTAELSSECRAGTDTAVAHRSMDRAAACKFAESIEQGQAAEEADAGLQVELLAGSVEAASDHELLYPLTSLKDPEVTLKAACLVEVAE